VYEQLPGLQRDEGILRRSLHLLIDLAIGAGGDEGAHSFVTRAVGCKEPHPIGQ